MGMRTILITVLGIGIVALVLAVGEPQKPSADVPPGVGLAEWIPLGESYGFVITSATTNRTQFVDNGLYGYYAIKKSGNWYRTYTDSNANTNGIRRIPFRS
jgi:hypothetical protein